MAILFNALALFVLAAVFLVISGGWVIKYLTRLSYLFKLSHFAIAFIIMAFATSIPELFVGISSAIAKNTSISLGNVIGANIIDLTLAIGIAALLSGGIKTSSPTLKRDTIMMLLISLAPAILMVFDKSLSRADGLILLLIFVIYTWHLFKEKKDYSNQIKTKKSDVILNLILFTGSVLVLFVSSHYIVKFGSELALWLAVPTIFIGLMFIALGTTLPELIFNARATLEKKPDLAIGNSMGSVVCNSTLVLGITALIYPIENNFSVFLTSTAFMIITSILFIFFIRRKKGLGIVQAVSLILVYILFIMFELLFKNKIF